MPKTDGQSFDADPAVLERIDSVAWEIKRVYISICQARCVGFSKDAVDKRWFDSVWRKAAGNCLQHGLDPESYVWAQLDEEPHPIPRVLIRKDAVQRALDTTKRRPLEDRERNDLQAQLIYLHLHYSTRAQFEEVLRDPNASLSPCVRYCVAARLGMKDLAAEVLASAAEELHLRQKLFEIIVEAGYLEPNDLAELRNATASYARHVGHVVNPLGKGPRHRPSRDWEA